MSKDYRILRELGVDVNNGIIPLIGDVSQEMLARIICIFNEMSNEGLGYETLTFILSTYGGDLYTAFGIKNILDAQEMNIRIVCVGPVMSAGTIILLAGDIREMTKDSYLMMHYGQDVSESAEDHKQNGELMKKMKEVYKSNSKISTKTLSGWFSRDTYYNAEQAYDAGLIDRIHANEEKPEKTKRTTRTRR